jgi:hypothetical protein
MKRLRPFKQLAFALAISQGTGGCREDFEAISACVDDRAFWQQEDAGPDGDLEGPYLIYGEAEWVKSSDCSLHVVTRFAANDEEDDLTAASIRESITLWVDQERTQSEMQTRAVGPSTLTSKNAGIVSEQRVCLERFVEQRRRGLTLVVRDDAGNLSNALCLRTFATPENVPDNGFVDDDDGV